MDCQTARELLPASVLDALEVDEELALLEHLRTCAACRAESETLRPVANSLGLAAVDAGEPSPQARLQVMARIASVPKPQAAPLPQHRWVFRPIAALVPAAIALLLIFGLGAAVISLQGQVSQQQARLDRITQQQVALRQFMLNTQLQPVAVKINNSNATATLYASNDNVAMAVTGLPTLEGDSVYQCWWINSKTGEVKPGAAFKVDANGAGVWAWARPDDMEYDQMTISRESQSGQTKPEGPVLITAEF
jgi:predicted anti-sigma-YlaC factor YlaD